MPHTPAAPSADNRDLGPAFERGPTTPFELEVEDRLALEAERFANEWLFKWHGMSYAGGVTDVDDFSGRRIHYEGIKYGPVQQQVFWDAVHRYLMKKVHEAFAEWQVATLNYPNQMRLWSLSELERDLRDFQVKIRELSMDTDQRLRGRRAPDGVSEVVAPRGSVSSEIARLAKAQRTLLIGSKDDTVRPTRTAIVRHIDSFYDNHKGLVWFAGLILAAITAVLPFLFR